MDPLNAVALITAGCGQRCASPVMAYNNMIAYSSSDSIYLYNPVNHKSSEITSRRSSSMQPGSSNYSGPNATGNEKVVTTYPLSRVFSNGVRGTIMSFHLNDEYVACVTSDAHAVVWKLTNCELLNSKAVLESVKDFFKSGGAPRQVLVSGKHHILFGTSKGYVVSANMHDGVTTHSAKVSADGGSHKHDHTAGAVCCMSASPTRPDVIAVGTSGGLLCVFSLHPVNGLKQSHAIKPFLRTSSSAAEKGKSGVTVSDATGNVGHGGEGDKDTCSHAVTSLVFDPNNINHAVAGSSEGALAVVDVTTAAVVQVFEVHDTPVTSISFLPAQAGTFVTTDGESSKLHVWTVTSRTHSHVWAPVWTTTHPESKCKGLEDYFPKAPAGDAIASAVSFASEHIVLSLKNGRVVVYSTQRHDIEFQTPPSHTDTLHSCRYAYHNKDVLATTGADGNVNMWNTRQLELQSSIYAGTVAVQGVDWSPTGKNIAVALSNGLVISYNVSTHRENWRITLTSSGAVSCIAWSRVESGSCIVAGYSGSVSLLAARDGKELRRYRTPTVVLSVDFDPRNAKNFSAACKDGQVLLFQTSVNRESPTLVLSGHTDAVTGVAYNGIFGHLLLSCSRDSTLRLWDLSTTTSHATSVSARVLRGHTGRVHAVAWCNAAPYLVLSAGADCTLRLWDIRTETNLFSARCSGSEVVALSSHPQRPFVFAAAARDGAVTFWYMGLLRHLSLEASLGTVDRCITSDDTVLMAAPSAATGNAALVAAEVLQHLCKELKDGNTTPQKRMELITDFFEFPFGAADISRIAKLASNPTDISHAECTVLPHSQLVEIYTARAKLAVDKARNKSVVAAGEAYKSARLVEAANGMLLVGKVNEYCDLMMEAGEWDSAISAAPLVSRDFWRSVCLKAAEAMKKIGDMRAVRYFIMAEESAVAARCVASQSEKNFDEAVVLLKTCPQRADEQKSAEPLHNTAVDTNGTSRAALELMDARATVFKNASNPRIVAASLLAEGANDDAAMHLIRSGDVTLAHLLIHTVPLQHLATIDAGYRLSMLQSCSQQQWDTALVCATRQSNVYDGLATVLTLYQHALINPIMGIGSGKGGMATSAASKEGDINGTQAAQKLTTFHEKVLNECKRLQLPLDMASIQQKHANDGLASVNQVAAMVLSPSKPIGSETGEDLIQTISSFIDNIFQVVLQDIDGAHTVFYLKQAYTVSSYVTLVIQGLSTDSAPPATPPPPPPPAAPVPLAIPLPAATVTATPPEAGTKRHSAVARKFLAQTFLLAALMCVKVYRFPKLLNPAFTKARELAGSDHSLMGQLTKAQPHLSAYSPHSVEVECSVVGAVLPYLSLTECTQYKSALTLEPIVGPAIRLEDGDSYISQSEALQWSMCCAFSPLATGAHLLPL
ncbi:hypothetical protein, conserved [Trypanosoma brucei gambiense DAL972]|uniref:Uncharacterized protein n=1 Tax=Trypanosoma brucei gambiense (strain MHOM/CI/86/DAL972) TaxID=679716 RepID=C9ZPI7_TRYB9|nr:hypothetical protein, conserved [Trypanosoma brucei gambiense DAL972]CBH11315.1 hypothetical protein, conserved [Trypanosoma brucei gambiense DAL972]|eukprot:XP_011773602.1 hypothetical protein, conserved [Trypanosoma brucei gambiense DAL972]